LVCGLADSDKPTPKITTTTLNNQYQHSFGGTSAATPMVSGVAALMLEANPDLTWRDVRLALADTARILPSMLADPEAKWITTKGHNRRTGKYRQYSHIYGFGLVDAEAAIEYVKKGNAEALIEFVNNENSFESVGRSSDEWWSSTRCQQTKAWSEDPDTHFTGKMEMTCGDQFVEFVEVRVEVKHPRFRDLKITLTTPEGTEMLLTDYYPYCGEQKNGTRCPTSDFNHEFITSVTAPIGEKASGHWTIHISDEGRGDVKPIITSTALTIH
jgi:proprotein convertase subtilisin/kexin type 2